MNSFVENKRGLIVRTMLMSAITLLISCTKSSNQAASDQTAPLSAPTSATAKVIGFSQIGAESAWRSAETKSIQDEAKNRGYDLRFSDAQQKQENQIKAIRTFIAQKVSAIVLAPVVETGWEPVLKEAKAANIPVILVDRGITTSDPSLYTTLIASDFVKEGHMAGDWLAKKTGGKAKIVEIQGTPGAAPANDRKAGFAEVLKANPGMQIIKSQTGEFTRAKGKEVMEAFLKSDGANIQAVYAHNDDMALGAIQAIDESGRQAGKDILVVSVDGTKDAFQAMTLGKLNAVVECNPLLGPAVFDAVDKLSGGTHVEQKVVVQDRAFDQSEAAAALPTRQY